MDTDKTVTQETETPATEAAPEQPQAEAPVKEQEEKKPPEGYVPHGALHQERMTRRRLERDLAEERMKWETANKRLEDLAKRFSPQEKVPDPQEDPVGALAHKSDRIDKRLEDWEKREQEREQQAAQQRQQQDLERHWSTSAQAFAAKQPDFPQAYEHLFRHAMEEFVDGGYDEAEATALVQGYWRDIVNRARRDGVNPAERMYSLAKRRGYKGQAKTEDKLDTIANGTKATSPLAQASGKAPSKLDMKALAEMPQEDFDKLSDADFRRIAAGG